MKIDALLTLARDLLQQTENKSEQLQDYAAAFESWQLSLPQLIETAKTDQELKAQLEELQQKHAMIVERVENMRGRAMSDLQSFRQKSRGLLAYADTLPKRISSRPGKKG